MQTVHALLRQSGQAVPAKHFSTGDNSLQVYDVEHWPETFNSLLLHDFPSIVISIDSSVASLSGFVVTLCWTPPVDISRCVCDIVHVFVFCLVLSMVVRACAMGLLQVSVDDSMAQIRELYLHGSGRNGTTRDFGAYAPSSLLTDQLRSFITQSEL